MLMMETILLLYHNALSAIKALVPMSEILSCGMFEKVIKIKYDIPNDKPELFSILNTEITDTFSKLIAQENERRAV